MIIIVLVIHDKKKTLGVCSSQLRMCIELVIMELDISVSVAYNDNCSFLSIQFLSVRTEYTGRTATSTWGHSEQFFHLPVWTKNLSIISKMLMNKIVQSMQGIYRFLSIHRFRDTLYIHLVLKNFSDKNHFLRG